MVWRVEPVEQLSKESLLAIINTECAALEISGFYPKDLCNKISDDFLNSPLRSHYRQANVSTDYVGTVAVEHRNDKNSYLAAAQRSNEELDKILCSIGKKSALIEVFDALAQAWAPHGIEVASEHRHMYSKGIVRVIRRSPLHNDFAPRDFYGWSISDIIAQLSWNLYLRSPGKDAGNTLLYKKIWKPIDENHKNKLPEMMGYDPAVVLDTQYCKVSPKVGNFVIFNARCYHEVLDAGPDIDRVSLSSFVGVKSENSPLFIWS